MELDEMKAAWARLERRLDATDARLIGEAQQRVLDRGRRSLRRFGWAQLLEIVAWALLIAVAAPFWVEHRATPHLLAAGLALHAYGIAAIWSAATRALLAARLYRTRPVVDMQRRLGQLRRFTTISVVLLGLPWWCLWLVALQVALMRWTGVDLYLVAPAWFQLTLATGVAGMAASLWLARRWSERPPRARWLQRMIDDLSGCNLRRAQRQLDEAASFQRA